MKRKIYKPTSNTILSWLALAFLLVSNRAYSQTTYTFNYTGSVQILTLQAGTYSIECWGGDGGSTTGTNPNAAVAKLGGKGGYARGTLTVAAVTTASIYVGGKGNTEGVNVAGGFNGGGNSGGGSGPSGVCGSGGGASDVRVGGNALTDRKIVAGGGGAAGYQECNGSANAISGGHGGGLTGGAPVPGAYANRIGQGGTQSAGGAGGTDATYVAGNPGGFGFGGNGGTVNVNSGNGAGGGGGWYGGGSGSNGFYCAGGGGGGSSYIGGVSSGTTIMFGQSGFVPNPDVTGHGRVLITPLCNINIGTTTGINSICQGAAVTLTTDAISSYTWSTGSNASSILVNPSVTTSYSLVAMSPSNCITGAVLTITVSNAAPVLTVSTSTNSICLGNTVNITASGALTYSISGGVSNAVSFTPVATTAYTVLGQNGCGTSSAVTTISVSSLPVVAITSTNVVCAGSTATLSGGGATTYTWSPGNFVGSSVLVSPQVNTTYTVIGSTGNCAGINTVAISTNPVPSLSTSTSNFTLCSGESATLTAVGALNYTWQPGGLIGPSVVVTPTIPTAFTVVGENSLGCTGSAQQPVIVYPTPSVNISSQSSTICPGASLTLVGTGANTYSWSTGATSNTISVSPAATTIYTVIGTFTNSQCSSNKTIEVNVFVSGLAINAPTAVCVGSPATLQATGAGTYSWSTGGTGNNIVVSPTVSSGYTVTGISTIGVGTCSSTASVQLAVNPLPTITIAATQTLVQRFCPVTFTASGALSYNWLSVGSGSIITVTPSVQTVYTVQGTDGNGCVGTRTILVRVGSEYCGWSVFENSYQIIPIMIYPNPSSVEFNISSDEDLELELVNELGQHIGNIELNQKNNHRTSMNDLSPGVYFLNSKDPTKKVNKKIVVQ